MVSGEALTPNRLVSSFPQPMSDLPIPHSTIMEFFDLVMKKLLVLGIRRLSRVRNSQNHLETEEHINVIRG